MHNAAKHRQKNDTSSTTKGLSDQWLQELRQRLEEARDVGLTLQQAADLIGYERTHFSKLFRKTTGLGFKIWSDKQRIERILPQLRHNKESITDIAFDFGFGDLTTFERTFQRITGITPREYRRKHHADKNL